MTTGGQRLRQAWLGEMLAQGHAVDRAIYDAVAITPTPALDRGLVRLTRAADHSVLWLTIAAVLAALGGARGRRAARRGVLAIAVASAVTNHVAKPLARRPRPFGLDPEEPGPRWVRRPTSTSFPSGHSASAFAFASAVGQAAPVTWLPLHVTASAVAYSRVHTGVHYPGDTVVGALLGGLCAWTARLAERRLLRLRNRR